MVITNINQWFKDRKRYCTTANFISRLLSTLQHVYSCIVFTIINMYIYLVDNYSKKALKSVTTYLY